VAKKQGDETVADRRRATLPRESIPLSDKEFRCRAPTTGIGKFVLLFFFFSAGRAKNLRAPPVDAVKKR
jgi:hypothetical protein